MTPKSFQISAIALFFAVAGPFSTITADEKTSESAETPAQYLLRYKFEPGEELRYESSRKMTMRAIAPAGQKVDVSKVDQRRLFRVGEVGEDGEAQVSMQFESVRMETQSDDREPIVFESSMADAEVPRIFRAAAHKLKGAAPQYVVRTAGTKLSDDGYEDVPENGQASFVIPMPENEIAVGESWKVFMNVKVRVGEGIMRDIKLLRTYKLASVEDDVALIQFSTSVAVRVRAPAAKAQLLEATPQGKIYFDIAKGRVVKKEMTFERSVLGALGNNTILSADGTTVETLLNADSESSVTKR